MGGPIAVDTPDYQRGVVNAQKLLAAPSATSSVIVSPPPNTESMILIADQPSSPSDVVWCQGQSSNAYAPVYRLPASNGTNFNGAWIFDVTSVIDTSYEVFYGNGSSTQWYVYADAAARVVVDGSKLVNRYGQQYVIPSVPGLLQNDHPPVELSYLGAYLNATGDVLAAPGAGQRLRVFAAQMGAQTAGVVGGLRNGAAGEWFTVCGVSGDSHAVFPLTGLPLPANESINYQLVAGAGFMLITVAYTVEVV